MVIEIFEPPFDMVAQGEQTVDSQDHICDQAAEAVWRVARVWRYVCIGGGPRGSHTYKYARNSPSSRVIVRSMNSTFLITQGDEGPLEPAVVDGVFEGLEQSLI